MTTSDGGCGLAEGGGWSSGRVLREETSGRGVERGGLPELVSGSEGRRRGKGKLARARSIRGWSEMSARQVSTWLATRWSRLSLGGQRQRREEERAGAGDWRAAARARGASRAEEGAKRREGQRARQHEQVTTSFREAGQREQAALRRPARAREAMPEPKRKERGRGGWEARAILPAGGGRKAEGKTHPFA